MTDLTQRARKLTRASATMNCCASVALGLASISSFAVYFLKPNTYQSDVLRGVGTYVQRFEGNPQTALDYVQRSIEVAGQGDVKIEELSDLESKVASMRANISQNPAMYKPALESLGKDIERVGSRYDRDPTWLITGIMQILAATGLLVSAAIMYRQSLEYGNRSD